LSATPINADRPADGDHLDVPVLQPAMEILLFVKLFFSKKLGYRGHAQPPGDPSAVPQYSPRLP
jgi:hypothetical protein